MFNGPVFKPEQTPQTPTAMCSWLGTDISTASNIVFANGLLDPWSGGGVLEVPFSPISPSNFPLGDTPMQHVHDSDLGHILCMAACGTGQSLCTCVAAGCAELCRGEER